MKRNLTFILLMMLVSMMGTRIAVNAQNLTLSDVQNSGCLRENQRRANGEGQTRTIVLLKEGNILSVQLLNYEANCGTEGFDVTPNMSGGSDGTQCSVNIQVVPVGEEDMDCICPYNVSFTVYGLETNSFRFNCWWFVGQVSLTEGEPLTLEDISESVNIDGVHYTLHKAMHTAKLANGKAKEGELIIPMEIYHEDVLYPVTRIEAYAFSGNSALTSVTIPNSVGSIGIAAFYCCSNLKDVYCYYEDNLPSIGGYTFTDSPVATATLHAPAGSIEMYKATAPWNEFGNIVGEGRVTIDGLNYYLNSSTYTALLTVGNTWEGELDIPSEVSFYGQAYTVTSMGLSAFFENDKLTKVRIPKTLNNILRWYYTTNPYEDVPTGLISSDCMNPFIGCTALESIEVDEENPSLKSIDGVLFSQDGKGYYYYLTNSYYGTGLYCYPAGARRESYTIPNGVEWIGSGAFGHNQYLSSLTMPSSLKQICNNVFAGCNNLTDIYCYAENVPVAFSYAFKDFPIASATLHVPAGSVEAYKATSPWSGFGNIVAIEEPHQPLPFLEGNPIWVYKYERLERYHSGRFIDKGNRSFTYYFLCGQKEIEGKVYTMIAEVINDGENELSVSRWLPVREENGIVYAITDSLPGLIEYEYLEVPYLQIGKECVLYNFCTEIGETLYPQNDYSTVMSYGTYQLMNGTICRVLKTREGAYYLYEKLGYLHDGVYGVMDPYSEDAIPTGGDVYATRLNAYFGDDMMLYKAPDAQEGLCVNDTCWTRDDAEAYARSYKADPRQEEVFSYIRQLQKSAEAEPVTYTEGQIATIILPTAPDASKGKYYRLDRCEAAEGQTGRQIVFEQELQPRARVPYIIVPSEDFSIDPSNLDLEGLQADTVSIGGVSFIGSYVGKELPDLTGASSYIDIIDTTPDCQASDNKSVIGALRAYLVVNWDDPYDQGGTRGLDDKWPVVLHDNGTGIGAIENKQLKIINEGNRIIFDLQGRKVANGRLPRGVYIEDGRKIVK